MASAGAQSWIWVCAMRTMSEASQSMKPPVRPANDQGKVTHLQSGHVCLVQVPETALLHKDDQASKSFCLCRHPNQQQGCQEVHALTVVDLRIIGCIRSQHPLKAKLSRLGGEPGTQGEYLSQLPCFKRSISCHFW